MNFNFFKNRATNKRNLPNNSSITSQSNDFDMSSINHLNDNIGLPTIYRGLQVYESESDSFCSFNEDYFIGENYEITKPKRKKLISISPPKTPPSFFLGILSGAISVLIISGGITFSSLFSKFGGIYRSVTVPNLTTLSEQEAISLITTNYDCFDYSIEYKENPKSNNGTVISQIPKPSTMRKLYGINGRICIKLTVSRENEKITLPNFIGQNARDVALELKNAGINVALSEVYSDTVKIGKIISSSHSAGSKLRKNDTVYITVSLGNKINYVNTPNLIGMSESEAIALLKAKNLEIEKVIYKNSSLPLGTVLEQNTPAGNDIREGSKITLSVSCGNAIQ